MSKNECLSKIGYSCIYLSDLLDYLYNNKDMSDSQAEKIKDIIFKAYIDIQQVVIYLQLE